MKYKAGFKYSLLLLSVVSLATLATEEPAAGSPAGMTLIPAGEFIMGSDKAEQENSAGEFGNAKPWYVDEHPEHKVTLPAYYLDTYEVTNSQYAQFIKAVNSPPPENWVTNGYILTLKPGKLEQAPVEALRKVVSQVLQLDIDSRTLERADLLEAINERLTELGKLPVTYVTWDDADAYCRWAKKSLPSEAQWEKAARGSQGSEFVWGSEWKAGMGNTGSEAWRDGAAPVGSYPTDKSPYGIFDLAGNVSEWVADWYKAYPQSDYSSKEFGEKQRVARGGAWGGEGHYTLHLFQRGAYRVNLDPSQTYEDVGIRCAKEG